MTEMLPAVRIADEVAIFDERRTCGRSGFHDPNLAEIGADGMFCVAPRSCREVSWRLCPHETSMRLRAAGIDGCRRSRAVKYRGSGEFDACRTGIAEDAIDKRIAVRSDAHRC